MTRHVAPRHWKSGMIEVGARVFAYVQASGIDPTGDNGVANSGLIVGAAGAVAVDALMVPTMTRKLVAAIKKTTKKPIAQLVNTHHHLDHTGGNRFFAGVTIVSSAACRAALAPGFPPVPLLQRFMPRFAAEFPKLQVVLQTVPFEDRMVLHDGDREIQLWHPGFAAHTVGDAVVFLPKGTYPVRWRYRVPLRHAARVPGACRQLDQGRRSAAPLRRGGHRPRSRARRHQDRPQAHARLPGAGAARGKAPVRRRNAGGGGSRRYQARRLRVVERR